MAAVEDDGRLVLRRGIGAGAFWQAGIFNTRPGQPVIFASISGVLAAGGISIDGAATGWTKVHRAAMALAEGPLIALPGCSRGNSSRQKVRIAA